jgi:AcrR family transcriptional regulator
LVQPAPPAKSPAKARAADTPKSLRTRARILDAVMRLLAEVGYAETTNARIATETDLTRGALLYHFPTREALLDAVIAHVQAARARLLQEAVDAAPHGADRTDHAIDAYWRLLHEQPFLAFAELEAAARAEPQLKSRLRTAQEAFDRAEIGDHLFDLVQGGEGPRFQASRDLARFMLEGLARARLTYDASGRTERLLAVVKRAARMLNRKGSVADLWEG